MFDFVKKNNDSTCRLGKKNISNLVGGYCNSWKKTFLCSVGLVDFLCKKIGFFLHRLLGFDSRRTIKPKVGSVQKKAYYNYYYNYYY